MKKAILIFLTAAMLLTVAAACGKKGEKDPNAVLTDSALPLEVGAEIEHFGTETLTEAASESEQIERAQMTDAPTQDAQ